MPKLCHILLVSALFLATTTMASGIVTHMTMSKMAMEKVKDPQLAQFLRLHERVFIYASVYPDSGYVEKDLSALTAQILPHLSSKTIAEILALLPPLNYPIIGKNSFNDAQYYGEISHWWPFLRTYRDYIFDNCGSDLAANCPQLVAHWLGCAAHSLQDEYYDSVFVPQVATRYFNGDNSRAASIADIGIDFFLIAADKIPLRGDFSELTPTHSLADIYKKMNVPFAFNEIIRGTSLLAWIYNFELVLPKLVSFKFMMLAPWMYKNYLNAAGGVSDTANKSALYLELLWSMMLKKDRGDADVRESVIKHVDEI